MALDYPGLPGSRSPQQSEMDSRMLPEPPTPPLPGTRFSERKNFDALAVFKGNLVTDASGHTRIKVKLPDNLTRYRIFSVATKDDAYFGTGDQVLTARLPLMVRPSLPRFLNFGDRAKLPVVVQNLSDEPIETEVVGEATGVAWVGPVGQKITVPAKDRVELSFECQADQVGTAHFRFGAVASSGRSDAARVSLPVYTPASQETFATYGSIDKDGALSLPVQRPSGIWTQLGGLQVRLSSTALSELTDAFLYLYTYPYECSEQKASRVLSIASLRDVLADFHAEDLPDTRAIESRLAVDLTDLLRLQNSDGGWEYWSRNGHSVPFVSLHVAHALVRSKLAGFEIEEDALHKAMGYLREIESKCAALKYAPETTRSCLAYALYVRQLNGDGDVAKAKSLFGEIKAEKSLDLEALGWLWPTLNETAQGEPELTELKRLVMNRATETAETAQFTTSYRGGEGESLLLHSGLRTDAILLSALLGDDSANPLNAKLLRGLLAHRVHRQQESRRDRMVRMAKRLVEVFALIGLVAILGSTTWALFGAKDTTQEEASPIVPRALSCSLSGEFTLGCPRRTPGRNSTRLGRMRTPEHDFRVGIREAQGDSPHLRILCCPVAPDVYPEAPLAARCDSSL